MENLVRDFLKQKSFAIAGSFRNETKYAYKILKDLTKRGHEVFSVNLALSEVAGKKCYKSVSDIPFKVDVVTLVTPPAVSEKIVRECLERSIERVWFQPGAESAAAIKLCRDNDIDVIYGLCVMIEMV